MENGLLVFHAVHLSGVCCVGMMFSGNHMHTCILRF